MLVRDESVPSSVIGKIVLLTGIRRIFHRHICSTSHLLIYFSPIPMRKSKLRRAFSGRENCEGKFLVPVFGCVNVLPRCLMVLMLHQLFLFSRSLFVYYFSLHSKLSLGTLNSWNFDSDVVTRIFLQLRLLKKQELKES